jgi:hypothetical protein
MLQAHILVEDSHTLEYRWVDLRVVLATVGLLAVYTESREDFALAWRSINLREWAKD